MCACNVSVLTVENDSTNSVQTSTNRVFKQLKETRMLISTVSCPFMKDINYGLHVVIHKSISDNTVRNFKLNDTK